jgi:hypothetical protein
MKIEVDTVPDHVDDPTVREIFADGVRLVSCKDGVLNLELTVQRPYMVEVRTPKMRTHTVGRLALTMAAGALVMEHIKGNLEQQAALRSNPSAPMTPTPKH